MRGALMKITRVPSTIPWVSKHDDVFNANIITGKLVHLKEVKEEELIWESGTMDSGDVGLHD